MVIVPWGVVVIANIFAARFVTHGTCQSVGLNAALWASVLVTCIVRILQTIPRSRFLGPRVSTIVVVVIRVLIARRFLVDGTVEAIVPAAIRSTVFVTRKVESGGAIRGSMLFGVVESSLIPAIVVKAMGAIFGPHFYGGIFIVVVVILDAGKHD